MVSKRRFGVSIPSDLADQLDLLAERIGRDRSSLVVEALKTFIHDHLHVLVPHHCTGIIVSSSSGEGISGSIIEKHRDIIMSYNHYHVDRLCIITIIVSGESRRIMELTRDLSRLGCSVRYIPLAA